jgi:hypothetical protein
MKLRRVLITLITVGTLAAGAFFSVSASEYRQRDAGPENRVELLPSVGLGLGYEWFAPNRYEYTSILRRAVDVTMLRFYGFFASFLVNEETLFSNSGGFRNYPYK